MRLLRTAARTAVITGTATRVHNRVSAKQHGRWSESTAAPTPAPPAADRSSVLAQLKELGELRDAGVLTDAEFEAEKAKILHSA